jgi:hypothetical protein
METAWESELAGFLTELSAVQGESLDVLSRKRQMLVTADTEGLASIGEEEQRLIEKLQACLARREELLAKAAQEGRPADSIRSLAKDVSGKHGSLGVRVNEATARARLLQHHGLVNWVLVQRTLIHLSQMLGIIATGAHRQPTYQKGEPVRSGGALVDQVV